MQKFRRATKPPNCPPCALHPILRICNVDSRVESESRIYIDGYFGGGSRIERGCGMDWLALCDACWMGMVLVEIDIVCLGSGGYLDQWDLVI